MDARVYQGFADELQKISARKDVTELLSNLATRKGLNPGKVPGIKQVGNVSTAQGNRPRAAQIASNVRSFLKSQSTA